jgi:hypothetical protein
MFFTGENSMRQGPYCKRCVKHQVTFEMAPIITEKICEIGCEGCHIVRPIKSVNRTA